MTETCTVCGGTGFVDEYEQSFAGPLLTGRKQPCPRCCRPHFDEIPKGEYPPPQGSYPYPQDERLSSWYWRTNPPRYPQGRPYYGD